MERPARTVLDALMRAGTRTVEETCRAFNDLAIQLDEEATLSERTLYRWMAGEVSSAQATNKRVAAAMWGLPFDVLTRPPATGSHPIERDPRLGESDSPFGLDTTADAAARESVAHASRVGMAVDPTSIEQLADDLRGLARRYHTLPPLVAHGMAGAARNQAYDLLLRTFVPTQQSDVYLLAGQACGLMAHASVDMAEWSAAAAQTRAARIYAHLIGHDGLMSWATGTAALIDYWSGQPQRAAEVAARGIPDAREGAPTARLWAIQARAYALAGGDPQRVHDAIGAGDRALDAADGRDDLFDEVGGEFGWGPSLHAACAGTALLAVRDYTGAAIRLARALDTAHEDPYGALVPERVYADVALAEVAGGRLNDAEAALDHVWPMPAAARRVGVVGRLEAVAGALGTGRWVGDPAATELRDRVLAFTGEAAEQWALPAS